MAEKIKETEEFAYIDKDGKLIIPNQEIFIDEEGNTKEYTFKISRPQNLQFYQKNLLTLATKQDYWAFGSAVFPKMIDAPAEARKIEFFENDSEALVELCEAIIEFMGKSQEKKKRRLNMKLK